MTTILTHSLYLSMKKSVENYCRHPFSFGTQGKRVRPREREKKKMEQIFIILRSLSRIIRNISKKTMLIKNLIFFLFLYVDSMIKNDRQRPKKEEEERERERERDMIHY